MREGKFIKILGVEINQVNFDEAAEICRKMLEQNEQNKIFTPNPEIVLHATNSIDFQTTINQSQLNIPDGTGLIWAAYFLNQLQNTHLTKYQIITTWIKSLFQIPKLKNTINKPLETRVTGVDLMEKICQIASEKDKKIFLLGGINNAAKKAQKNLEQKFKNLKIVGAENGPENFNTENQDQNDLLIKNIRDQQPDIIFIALGAPKQEKWISQNIEKIPSIKIAMGVGGAFDFIAGAKKRSPIWMQKLGLEWFFRLIQEPSRIKRIFRATITFPVKVLQNELKKTETSL